MKQLSPYMGMGNHWRFNKQNLRTGKCFCGCTFETYQPQRKYCDTHVNMPQSKRDKEKAEHVKKKLAAKAVK